MTSSIITFDDFSGGEYGDKGAHRAAPNEWTGHNVMVGQDGCIGPRPGLRKHTLVGMPAGDLWGIKYIGMSGRMLLVCVDDEIYSTDVDSGTITLTLRDTLDATPTEQIQVDFYDPNGDLYLTNPDDSVYVMDWPAGSLSTFQVASDTHGFRGLRLNGDRLLFFDDATSPQDSNPSWRVYFSEPADFTNFPDANQFDIGYFGDLYAALPIGNHLYFSQRAQQGSSGGWWALIGASPTNQILRRVKTDTPQFNAASGESMDGYVYEHGRIWYFRPGGHLAVGNGAEFDEMIWSHLVLGPVSDVRHGIALSEDGQDVVFVDESRALIRHWGTWCFADFDVELDGQISNTEFRNRVIIAGVQDGDSKHTLYSFDLSLDRPGFIDDDHAQPGDHSDTPVDAGFTTPLWFEPKRREFRVRKVMVDIIKYDWTSGAGEGGEQNEVTITARTYARANYAGGSSDGYHESTQTWSEDAVLSTESGVRDRIVLTFGEGGFGGAFEIDFSQMVGIKIVPPIAVELVWADSDAGSGPGRNRR